MRLGTLARKLDINTDEVVSYLSKNGIEIEDGPNTKLDQIQLDLVNSAFHKKEAIVVEEEIKPEIEPVKKQDQSEYLQDADDFSFDVFGIAEEMEGFVASVNELTSKGNDRSQQIEVKESPESKAEDIFLSTQEDELSIEELAARDDVKTLRAKKVKLGGIKVVGKIDLPEPKKKPEISDSEPNEESEVADIKNTQGQEEEKPKGLYGDFVKQQRKTQTRNNTSKGKQRKQLSFEEKQKREEQRVKREKERARKALKKKKEAHYKNTILPKIEASAPKTKKKSKKVEKELLPESKKNQSKNPIQKLWAWLNGEYDKF